jgi:hypothetical protein
MASSRHSSPSSERDDHRSSTVRSRRGRPRSRGRFAGGSSCEGNQVRRNGTRSPASTTNSLTVVKPSPWCLHGCLEQHGVGPAHGAQATLGAAHEGDDVAVVEAQGQLHAHGYTTTAPFDDAEQVDPLPAQRHEVDDPDLAVFGLEVGLEDERVVPVRRPTRARRPGERSASIRGRSSPSSGEDRRRVEPGQAEPVDRSVLADQGDGVAVADHRVVLEGKAHVLLLCPSATTRRPPPRQPIPGEGVAGNLPPLAPGR